MFKSHLSSYISFVQVSCIALFILGLASAISVLLSHYSSTVSHHLGPMILCSALRKLSQIIPTEAVACRALEKFIKTHVP